ncbi:hypothetical protein Cni_G14236 [Canna indica]|uniref:Uncharacterized protein n=1 Tax=Canna indica TaxID=4628 RepID=A0AAQ3KFW6_9LILI|nr:hypothetical protein Cni_G14236 [Canna indica]
MTALSLASKKIKLYVISDNYDWVKLTEVEDEAENTAMNEDDNALEVGENEADNEGKNVAGVGENEIDVGEKEGENVTDVAENEANVDDVGENEFNVDDILEDIHFDDSEDENGNDHFGDYIDATVNEVAPFATRSEAPRPQPSTNTGVRTTLEPNIAEDEYLESEQESEQLYFDDDSENEERRHGCKYNPTDMGPNFRFKLGKLLRVYGDSTSLRRLHEFT